jgi:hypothetical protein
MGGGPLFIGWIIVLIIQTAPFAAVIFLLLIFLSFKVLKQNPNWPLITVVTIILALVVSKVTLKQIELHKYHVSQKEAAQTLSFTLYEPSYIVPGFHLVHSSVELLSIKKLQYNYSNESIKNSRNPAAGMWYDVSCQSSIDKKYNSSIFYHIVNRDFGNTTVFVSGRITLAEIEKVLASMRQVRASDIKFRW